MSPRAGEIEAASMEVEIKQIQLIRRRHKRGQMFHQIPGVTTHSGPL
jgi:hypothetical protein